MVATVSSLGLLQFLAGEAKAIENVVERMPPFARRQQSGERKRYIEKALLRFLGLL